MTNTRTYIHTHLARGYNFAIVLSPASSFKLRSDSQFLLVLNTEERERETETAIKLFVMITRTRIVFYLKIEKKKKKSQKTIFHSLVYIIYYIKTSNEHKHTQDISSASFPSHESIIGEIEKADSISIQPARRRRHGNVKSQL